MRVDTASAEIGYQPGQTAKVMPANNPTQYISGAYGFLGYVRKGNIYMVVAVFFVVGMLS